MAETLTVIYKSVWPQCGNCLRWQPLADQPGSGQCTAITDDDADAMKLPLRRPVVMVTHQETAPCPLPVMRCGASRWEQKWLTAGCGDDE